MDANSERVPSAPPGPRSRLGRVTDRLHRTDPVVLAMVVALPLVKLVGVASVKPTTYPDTPTYRHVGHWLDFSLSSIDGASIRPFGATAWLALWPNDRAIMVAQALLSGIAWGVLALVIAAGMRGAGPRRLFAALLVLIPCTAQMANWDTIILGDSIAMTTGILALAALIRLTRRPTWGRALTFLPIALWYTMTRPNLFVVLLAWSVGLALVAVLSKKVMVLGIVAGALVLFSGYSYAYNVHSDGAWTAAHGFSRSTVGMGYPLGKYDPVASKVLVDLRKSDAPRCMIPSSPAVVSLRGSARWVGATVAKCPGMNEWATNNWQRWWIGWLFSHPKSMLRIIETELPQSLSPSVWGNVVAATPPSVASLYFGTPAIPQDAHPRQNYRVQPVILWIVAAAILAIFAARRRRWRGSPWGVDIALASTVLGGLACAVSSGLLIQTAPHEVAQESLGATVVITAALVAAVALGYERVRGTEVRGSEVRGTEVRGTED